MFSGLTGTLATQPEKAKFLLPGLSVRTGGAQRLSILSNGKTVFNANDITTAFQINKTNGTSIVFNVDTTNGRVGIGTSSPTHILELSRNAFSNRALDPYLLIRQSAQDDFASVGVLFQPSYQAISASIVAAGEGNGSANTKLQFNVGNQASYPTRMSISSTGNVGIGTDASARLHVVKTTEQFRLGYDASNYLSATINSTGSATLNLTGTSPVLSLQNGTNAQTFHLYGTYTDASNYRRLNVSSTTAGVFTISANGAGTGASGNLFKLTSPTLIPSASITPATNGDLDIEATNDTTLTFKLKGSDGTVRSGTITLA